MASSGVAMSTSRSVISRPSSRLVLPLPTEDRPRVIVATAAHTRASSSRDSRRPRREQQRPVSEVTAPLRTLQNPIRASHTAVRQCGAQHEGPASLMVPVGHVLRDRECGPCAHSTTHINGTRAAATDCSDISACAACSCPPSPPRTGPFRASRQG
jgi:hypothetical protein